MIPTEPADETNPRVGLELIVVGTALMQPNKFAALSAIVSPDMIEHTPARIVWDLLAKRIPKGLPVTFEAMSLALGEKGLRRIGGPARLSVIGDKASMAGEWHAEQLRAVAIRDQAKRELYEALEQLDKDEDLLGAIDATSARVAKVRQQAEASGIVSRQTRRLVMTPASQIPIRPVRWLWDTTPENAPPTSHGRIPMDTLAIAAGGPGLGKSQWACWLTARVTTGTLPGQLFGKPRSVIYAATEDSWSHTIAPRMVAAGADMDLVFRADVQDDGNENARLSLPVDIALLGRTAEEYGVALMVADPLLSHIDSNINDYRAAEVREALEPLVAAADRHGFTVVGLAHFTKAGGADPLSRVAGSGAFGQLIRSLVAFAQEETDEGDPQFVMSLEKNNLGRLGLPSFAYSIQGADVETPTGVSHVSKFVLGGESSTSVREVMRSDTGAPGVSRGELNEAAIWLRDYLLEPSRVGQALPKEINAAGREAGFTPNAIREAKEKLKIKSVKPRGVLAGPWMWVLPEAHVEASSSASSG